MSKIETVEGYQTSDGKFFVDEADAQMHEYKLDMRKTITNFGENRFWDGMSRTAAIEALVEHAEELWKAVEAIDMPEELRTFVLS